MPHFVRRTATPPAAGLVALAALVVLTGCTGGDPDATPTPSVTATPTPAPTPTATPTPTPTPAVPFELGTPGVPTPESTRLARGDEAVLQKNTGLDPAGERYTESQWASTVVDVVAADPAEIATVAGPEAFDPATQQAYYVRTSHRLVWARGNSDATSLAPPHVLGWGADGAGAGDLLPMGLFAPCRTDVLAEPAVDAVVAACTIAVLPAGQPIGYVGVDGNPQVTRDANAPVTSDPVVWVLEG
ncbi:hypothetical protein ACWFNE_18550 [Cellulomonas sp. NPDC055163]